MKDGVIRPDTVVGQEFGHPDTETYQQQTADSIYVYFEEVIGARDTAEAREDLLTHLLTTEVEGNKLTHEEILDVCFLFLIAGLDTVTASLDCVFAHLAQHPEARRRIVGDPDAIPAMVEELLRWETPVMGAARVATSAVDIDGFSVSEGEQVMVLLGAANVDEAEFSSANELDWDRETNRHLAFGGGIHRCLGSHLARMELRVALREWHRRIPDYSIKPDAELTYTAGIRTIGSLPIMLSPTG
jgi:cytochrome P450